MHKSVHLAMAMVVSTLLGVARPARADKIDDLSRTLKNDPDAKVRLSAAIALGRAGGARAIDPLTAALSDKDVKVRGVAAVYLGKIVDASTPQPQLAKVLTELDRVANNDPDSFVRGQARKSHTALKPLVRAAAARAVYVVVTLHDGTGNAAALVPTMQKVAERAFSATDPSFTTQWPGKKPTAADLSAAGTVGFRYDATLASMTVKASGNNATVTCTMSGRIEDYGGKLLVPIDAKRNRAQVDVSNTPTEIDRAKQACATALASDIVAKQVAPEILSRAGAVASGTP